MIFSQHDANSALTVTAFLFKSQLSILRWKVTLHNFMSLSSVRLQNLSTVDRMVHSGTTRGPSSALNASDFQLAGSILPEVTA